VLVALAAFLLKTAIAFTTYGSTDVLIFETDVAKMRRDGGLALYRDGISIEWCDQIEQLACPPFNHPPFMIQVLAKRQTRGVSQHEQREATQIRHGAREAKPEWFLFVSVILGACSVGASYQEALGASSSVQALGHRAWLRISGTGEPSERMTMLRAIRARAELEKLRDIGREYTVSEKAVPTLRSVIGVAPGESAPMADRPLRFWGAAERSRLTNREICRLSDGHVGFASL
jgi:hypothetical protein